MPGSSPGMTIQDLGRPESLVRLHRDVDPALLLGRIFDLAIAEREQGVVPADADAVTVMPFGAALADNDVARKHALAARLLDPEPPPDRVAAVAGGAACFLLCHGCLYLFFGFGAGFLAGGLAALAAGFFATRLASAFLAAGFF